MIAFLLGAASVFAVLLGSVVAANPWLHQRSAVPHVLVWLLLSFVLLPLLGAWTATELVNWATPRRLFDSRRRSIVSRFILGTCAGLLATAATSLLIALADSRVPEALITTVCSATACLLILLPLSRTRPGRCIHCAYDLTGATVRDGGRCPECGANAICASVTRHFFNRPPKQRPDPHRNTPARSAHDSGSSAHPPGGQLGTLI